jgi:hypothetical protein
MRSSDGRAVSREPGRSVLAFTPSTGRAVPPHRADDDRRRGRRRRRRRTMPHRNAHRALGAVVRGPSVRVAQELVGLAERGELCRGHPRIVRPDVRMQAVYCSTIGTRQLAPGGVRPNPQDLIRIVHGHRCPTSARSCKHPSGRRGYASYSALESVGVAGGLERRNGRLPDASIVPGCRCTSGPPCRTRSRAPVTSSTVAVGDRCPD